MVTIISNFMPWVGLFLLFLSITKLIQMLFIIVTDLKQKKQFHRSTRDQVLVWLALCYCLTSIVFFAS